MSERELAELFRATGQDLDARQRARFRQLKGIQRDLFEELAKVLVEALDKGDGKITDRRGSVSVSRLVDQIFRAIERNQLKDFYREAVKDMGAILNNGALYAKEVKPMKPSAFNEVHKLVNRAMRKRFGLDPDTGKPIKGGTIARVMRTDPVSAEVKAVIMSGVLARKDMGVVLKEVEKTVKGGNGSPGSLSSYYSSFLLDTYQQFDRATTDEYAKRLDLQDFIYQGGLIETSREFCIKKDGKVFTKEEAMTKWPLDSTLPRTSKERKTGVLIDYNPMVDMGRWNCRHRPRPVSPERAERLRDAGR